MSSEVVTPFRLRNPFQSCHVHGFDLSIAVLEELCVLSCSTPNSLRCGMAIHDYCSSPKVISARGHEMIVVTT
jgi:hypothetical protein